MFRSEFSREEFPNIQPAYLSSQNMKESAVRARIVFVLGLIGTIASIIILTLGCSSIFGPNRSPGFIGSITSGSIGTFLFSVPAAVLLISRHLEMKTIENELKSINEANGKESVFEK